MFKIKTIVLDTFIVIKEDVISLWNGGWEYRWVIIIYLPLLIFTTLYLTVFKRIYWFDNIELFYLRSVIDKGVSINIIDWKWT